MPPPILDAKLHPPVLRRHLTRRPHLDSRLDDGVADNHRLLLICAPAGYGKTTLVAEWIATCSHPTAWLSLDEAEGDPVQFVTAVAAALQNVRADLGATIMRRLQTMTGAPPSASGQEASATLAAILTADLAQHSGALLVLDDFHLAATPAVCAITQALIDRAPALTLVITTRTEPDLALSRLRVRNQLTEVTALDLRFSPEETTHFLRQTMQLDISVALGAELAQRTEGWAGALQLAALTLRGLSRSEQQAFVASFSGDHRHLADYLSSEVLRQLPMEMRRFLLITSPLTRMCASICDDLCAEDQGSGLWTHHDSQTMLEEIERRNLFLIPLDARRQWYRYHHLFAGLLRARLALEAPSLVARLHRRTALWHLHAGDADAAMEHALHTGDAAFAADMAQQFGVQMVGGSRLGAFLQWLDRIDPAAVATRPYLLVGAAWTNVLVGRVDQALHDTASAEQALNIFDGFDSIVDKRRITTAEVRGHLNAVRGYAARLRGDGDSVVHYARLALDELPKDAATARSTVALNLALMQMERGELEAALDSCAEAYAMGMQHKANLFVALTAVGLEGEILLQRGRLQAAANAFQRVLMLVDGEEPPPPAVGMGYYGLARIALLRGDPAEARRLLEMGMQFAEEMASSEPMEHAALFAVEIDLYTTDLDAAERHLARANAVRQPTHAEHAPVDDFFVLHSQLSLYKGDLAAATTWLEQMALPEETTAPSLETERRLAGANMQRARLLLAARRPAEALHLIAEIEQWSIQYADWHSRLTALVLRAHALEVQGSVTAARTALLDALALAAPQDAAGPIVSEGRALVDLLASIGGDDSPVADLAARVVVALSLAPTRAPTSALANAQPLIEPLSDRELEVLHLMALGRTNKAIAATLIVASSTIKTHVNHILAKLGAANRTEAVALARAAGIVE